ncbi:MAG: AraC family transcriptional regulator [Citrobacter sp.]|uniref:helix-turn-helix transcriptional regulator n=1 Tax=Citrobacter sp. TaxID=1896336 RepID=UPI002FCB7BAE
MMMPSMDVKMFNEVRKMNRAILSDELYCRLGGVMNKDDFYHVLVWVEENLCTGEDVGALVRESGYGRRAFEQGFRSRSGFSPGEYLFRRRMSRAAVMLRVTSLPVTEIAGLLHYHSGQNFARAFRGFSGWTPTAYRRDAVWNTRILQLPLLYGEECFHSTVVDLSESLRITGRCKSTESRYDSMSDSECLSTLRNQLNSLQPAALQKGALVLTRITGTDDTYAGRNGVVRVEIVTGTQSAPGEIADGIIPAGRYTRYVFSGSWEAFTVFSRTIYLRSLAEQSLCNSEDLNFMQVNFAGDSLECALYIPVVPPPG